MLHPGHQQRSDRVAVRVVVISHHTMCCVCIQRCVFVRGVGIVRGDGWLIGGLRRRHKRNGIQTRHARTDHHHIARRKVDNPQEIPVGVVIGRNGSKQETRLRIEVHPIDPWERS